MTAPDGDERALDAWSRLHGVEGASSAWVAGWVGLVHRLARPLARRGAAPDAVTAAGVVVTALALAPAGLPGAWPLLVVPLVVAAALLDGVDGAVAVQTGRATRWGEVLDALADRVCDLLLLAVLVVLGGPWWLAVAAGSLTLLLESTRAGARAAGMSGPGAITVWERPSRVLATACGAGLAGALGLARAAGVGELPDLDRGWIATAALAAAVVLSLAGLARLLATVRGALTDG